MKVTSTETQRSSATVCARKTSIKTSTSATTRHLVWLLTLCGTLASAQPALDLTWQAPAACPQAEVVQREVARLEGRRTTLSTLRVTVRVRPIATGWSAVLQTDSNGVSGERSFEARECAQLAEAAALIIAMAHCPELASSGAELAPDPEVPQPSPNRTALALGGFGGADLGSLVAPSFNAGLELDLRVDSFSLRALALRSLEQRRLAGPRADSTLAVQTQLGLGARGCWYPLDSRVSLGPCLGIDAWLVSATTSNISLPSSGSAWWLGGVLGAQLRLALFDRLALSVSVEAAAAATRPVFLIEGYGQVFRTGEIVGRFRAGLEVRLW